MSSSAAPKEGEKEVFRWLLHLSNPAALKSGARENEEEIINRALNEEKKEQVVVAAIVEEEKKDELPLEEVDIEALEAQLKELERDNEVEPPREEEEEVKKVEPVAQQSIIRSNSTSKATSRRSSPTRGKRIIVKKEEENQLQRRLQREMVDAEDDEDEDDAVGFKVSSFHIGNKKSSKAATPPPNNATTKKQAAKLAREIQSDYIEQKELTALKKECVTLCTRLKLQIEDEIPANASRNEWKWFKNELKEAEILADQEDLVKQAGIWSSVGVEKFIEAWHPMSIHAEGWADKVEKGWDEKYLPYVKKMVKDGEIPMLRALPPKLMVVNQYGKELRAHSNGILGQKISEKKEVPTASGAATPAKMERVIEPPPSKSDQTAYAHWYYRNFEPEWYQEQMKKKAATAITAAAAPPQSVVSERKAIEPMFKSKLNPAVLAAERKEEFERLKREKAAAATAAK